MNQEIERKFIINPLNETYKDLIKDTNFTIENRYYLFKKGCIELRFTSRENVVKGTDYTLDRMEVVDGSMTVRTKERLKISKDEFDTLLKVLLTTKPDTEPITRHSYDIAHGSKIQLKAYKGKFEGLVRAEIEFDSQEESEKYKPLSWMGTEISNTLIGNDVTLADLSQVDLAKQLEEFTS